MTRKIDGKHACSFTGHRPERLELTEAQVIQWLSEQIRQAVEDGYTEFVSGMQRGVDIWAAEEVLKLREQGAAVRLIAASAFEGMESRWSNDWRARYERILEEADEVTFVSRIPGRRAFFQRNHWMVDRSTRLIGVYTGAPGGTKETIEYAKMRGLQVVLIDAERRKNIEPDRRVHAALYLFVSRLSGTLLL